MNSSLPVWTLSIITLSIFGFFFENISSVFIYDRNALIEGEYWRLISGHLVHFSPMHLTSNVIAFAVTGWLIENRGYPKFSWLIFLMAFSISISLLLFKPELHYYGGISGLVHGGLYYLALFGTKEEQPWRQISWIIILILPLKVALEIYQENSLLTYVFTETYITIPLSHMIGISVALLLFLVIKYK